jgi:hypothetical protein
MQGKVQPVNHALKVSRLQRHSTNHAFGAMHATAEPAKAGELL